jgi:hypothetical protein
MWVIASTSPLYMDAVHLISIPYLCLMDSQQLRLFELKLGEIYNKTEWLQYEITLQDFIALFPIEYKGDKAQRPDMPEDFDLDRNVRLAIMVAFREAFS